ncbi:MAG TPA: type I restriction enzyme HsdR N-terminal domain-containing protein [Chitinophagales bacterium]|jgi:hypothetical protein|nr:type I restriction enzyme HsdR N-terminal domain-containing protein [Chitinophagales bacterium]MBP6155220.1 type I restriction enzyme HsdR N-terminal domain-containing protein [Chitinophagales bacterium]HQV77492.1 type I restriction enzyme HsdR N-terminal domain-containing protein [Chitinophagales bacterium]HQW78554.1 type I restriction enzyme HsdR N-terminal domain-containing protein [Chitinophagales bacterium]HRB19200.1 type I restriction enzyme HsdR N-terminal domain-containing protein [C
MEINPPKIKLEDGIKFIFCAVRKKWLQLTPEEKVRQFIIFQLVNSFHFPLKYISVEKMILVNGLKKRYDIVVYNQALQASILIECKAENIEISEATCQQIATYNLNMQVPYLMISNGKMSYYFEIKNDTIVNINQLPPFSEL